MLLAFIHPYLYSWSYKTLLMFMNNKTEVNREQLQLKVIEFLRFPLIVGVVLIHTQVAKINGVVGDIAAPYPFNGVYPLYEFFSLFVNIIKRVAVPLFFVFSGYLFFYKIGSFTSGTYFMKLKKRVRSLLVPYLFWITLLASYYVILDKFVLEEPLYLTSVDGLYSIFYNFNKTGYPISIQFWYIRDLMVTILLSPIIYWLIKKCHIYFVIVLSVLWITNYWPLITGLNITALFFFSLGAYFSICRKNFIEIIRPHIFSISLLYILIIIILLYCRNCEHIVYVKRIGIVLGMAFWGDFQQFV